MEEKSLQKEEKQTLLVKVKEKTAKLGEGVKKFASSGITMRKVIIASSVLLLGAAVWLNYSIFGTDPVGGEGENDPSFGQSAFVSGDWGEEEEDYFALVELSRQKARDESMTVLRLVVDNENALDSAKEDAGEKIAQTAMEMQDEANIEALVESKGFENCVAVISDGKANIVVKSDGLMQNEIVQIQEIVYEQTGIVPANVRIIEKN